MASVVPETVRNALWLVFGLLLLACHPSVRVPSDPRDRDGQELVGDARPALIPSQGRPRPQCPTVHVQLVGALIVTAPGLGFPPGEDLPGPCFGRVLRQIVWFVRMHPEIHKVRVEGHIFSEGGAAYEALSKQGQRDWKLKMSQCNADQLRDQLITAGMDRYSIASVGYGDRRPKVPRDVDRTELLVVFRPASARRAPSATEGPAGRGTAVSLATPEGIRATPAELAVEAKYLERDLSSARRLLRARRFQEAYRLLGDLVARAPDRIELRELYGVAQAAVGDLSGANDTAAWVERRFGAVRAEELRQRQLQVTSSRR